MIQRLLELTIFVMVTRNFSAFRRVELPKQGSSDTVPTMNLYLPDFYQENPEPTYFTDYSSDTIYQPHVYDFAYSLAKRMGVRKIVDLGAGNGQKLERFKNEFEIVAVDFGNNLDFLDQQFGKAISLEVNFEEPAALVQLKPHVKDSLVIFSDDIEHLLNPLPLLDFFRENLSSIFGLVVSTPDRQRARGTNDLGPPQNLSHVREWALKELNDLLMSKGLRPLLHGYTVSSSASVARETQVAFVPGDLSCFVDDAGFGKDVATVSALAIIPCYNEEDIIVKTVSNLLEQGIDVHVLDNWSSDGSWNLLAKAFAENGRVSLSRFPHEAQRDFNLRNILSQIASIGAASKHDWILHVDADEELVSSIPGMTLLDFLTAADRSGYNVVDCTVLNFRPYRKSPLGKIFLDKWEFETSSWSQSIERAWKNSGFAVGLSKSGGHIVEVEEKRLFPLNLAIKHFPLRSPSQARKKIFRDRLPRTKEERSLYGFHTHYDSKKKWERFLWKQSLLKPWDESVISEFMPEITSRSGLKIP